MNIGRRQWKEPVAWSMIMSREAIRSEWTKSRRQSSKKEVRESQVKEAVRLSAVSLRCVHVSRFEETKELELLKSSSEKRVSSKLVVCMYTPLRSELHSAGSLEDSRILEFKWTMEYKWNFANGINVSVKCKTGLAKIFVEFRLKFDWTAAGISGDQSSAIIKHIISNNTSGNLRERALDVSVIGAERIFRSCSGRKCN